jgi:hypothetical protein
MTVEIPRMMKVMTVPPSPGPSPAGGEGRFVSRIRDFHINHESSKS